MGKFSEIATKKIEFAQNVGLFLLNKKFVTKSSPLEVRKFPHLGFTIPKGCFAAKNRDLPGKGFPFQSPARNKDLSCEMLVDHPRITNSPIFEISLQHTPFSYFRFILCGAVCGSPWQWIGRFSLFSLISLIFGNADRNTSSSACTSHFGLIRPISFRFCENGQG